MPKALVILHKVLVNYFYRVNGGLFAFTFLVLFGSPNSPVAFHNSLISGIIRSQVFLSLVMLCWLLYNFKCIDYIIRQLQHSRQSFFFCLNVLSAKKLYLYQLYVQVLVYMPVLLYSIAIIVIAFNKRHYFCAAEVILFDAIVVLATPYLYMLAIRRKRFTATRSIIPRFNLKIRKPYFLFPLYFLIIDKKQMILVTKIFSLLFLYGFIKLYEPEHPDIRPLQLCLLIVAASHTAIVYEIRMFEVQYLEFSKNLPLTITVRFVQLSVMYLCLLLPELIFIFKGINVHFYLNEYPQLLLMILSLLCLFHVALIADKTNMEQLIRIVFAILAVCFFIILYNPGIVLPLAILALAFALFNAYFYYYEKTANL